MTDDDFALAMYVAYELHYRGFAGVDDEVEWDPGLLTFRAHSSAPSSIACSRSAARLRHASVEADLSDLLA